MSLSDFRRLWLALMRRASRLARVHDREDVAAEVLLRCWWLRSAHLTTPQGVAYAVRAAANLEADLLRRTQWDLRIVEADLEAVTVSADRDFEEPGAREKLELLLPAVMPELNLTEQAVLLRLRQGVTNQAEIARALGCTRQAVALALASIRVKAQRVGKKLAIA